jgi:hypothetical protein
LLFARYGVGLQEWTLVGIIGHHGISEHVDMNDADFIDDEQNVVRSAVTGRVSRPIGYFMALCGLCYLAQGWIIGSSGFSSANQIPTLGGIGLILLWTVWLLIAALRMKTAALRETTSDATT